MQPYKPKLLLITLRADIGGGPEVMYRTLPVIKKHFDVFIASPTDEPYWQKFADMVGNDNIIKLPHRKFTIKDLFHLIAFVRKNDIKIIHSHGKGAGIYSRPLAFITGAKCVHTLHGVHTERYNGAKKFIYLKIELFLSLFTNIVTVCSESEKQQAVENSIAPHSKIVLNKNGVLIPPSINRFSYNEPFNILHISRFDKEVKNSEFLVEIAKVLRDKNYSKKVKIILVGDGPMLPVLLKRAKTENILEMFVSHGISYNTEEYYKNAYAFVSCSRREGLPMTLLEAMSYGLPLVITRVVGNKDVMNDKECGFFYEEGDAVAAAQHIINIIDNTELHKSLSEKAREWAIKNFSVERSGNKFVEVYKSLANSPVSR